MFAFLLFESRTLKRTDVLEPYAKLWSQKRENHTNYAKLTKHDNSTLPVFAKCLQNTSTSLYFLTVLACSFLVLRLESAEKGTKHRPPKKPTYCKTLVKRSIFSSPCRVFDALTRCILRALAAENRQKRRRKPPKKKRESLTLFYGEKCRFFQSISVCRHFTFYPLYPFFSLKSSDVCFFAF